jgi:hypothetical protein
MPADLTTYFAQLHARLDALAHPRGSERAFGVEARMPSYAGLDDMREDRAEYREMQELDRLQDRLDDMQQAQHPGGAQGHGMEW